MKRVTLLVLAVSLAAAAVVLGQRAARTSFHVGDNRLVNAPQPIDANNTPSLARNPRRPDNVALTHRVDRPAFSSLLHWSTDGGRQWRPTELPLPGGIDRPFAPDIAFGPDGTLYVSYVNLVGEGNVPDNLWVARSTDGGRTLSEPARVTGRLAFGARLVVGPDGTVHVTWLQAAEGRQGAHAGGCDKALSQGGGGRCSRWGRTRAASARRRPSVGEHAH